VVDASRGVSLILALMHSTGGLVCCQFLPLTLVPFFPFGRIEGNPAMDKFDAMGRYNAVEYIY